MMIDFSQNRENESEGLLLACSIGVKESKSEFEDETS